MPKLKNQVFGKWNLTFLGKRNAKKNEKNINSWLVKNGYALAYKKYSKKYLLDEQYAKQNKLGLWRGTFMKPEKWRRIFN